MRRTVPFLWMVTSLGLLAAAGEPELPKGVASVCQKLFANRVFIPVTLNGGTSCEAVIDTGSEATLINRAKVKVPGLRVVGTQQFQGSFVGGISAEKVVLDSLAIGDWSSKGLTVGAIDHRPGQALEKIEMVLGMDLLGRSRFTLDFAHERFLIWPPRSELPKAADGVERVALSTHRGLGDEGSRPRIYATIGEQTRVSFLVDTGADGPHFVALKKPEDFGLAIEPDVAGYARVNDAGQSRQLPMRKANFPRLDFGRMSFRDVPGKIIDATAVNSGTARQDLQSYYNVLGTPFLKNLSAVHFDLPARTVYFDRAKDADTSNK